MLEKERIFKLSDIRKFYEIVKSNKYKKLSSGVWNKYLPKICKIVLREKDQNVITHVRKIFGKTEIINSGLKWDSQHCDYSIFVLPKHSSLITKATPFAEFIYEYGLKNFISALKNIADEYG